MPEAAETTPQPHPLFTPEELAEIKVGGKSHIRDRKITVQSEEFWEAELAAFLLSSRHEYSNPNEYTIHAQKNKKGKIKSVTLVYGDTAVYPIFTKNKDTIESLQSLKDIALTADLRWFLGRVVRTQSKDTDVTAK